MIFRVIDFETTNFPPDAQVIEAAYIDVTAIGFVIKPGWSSLVKPSLPINIEARAVHHISDKDAAKGISWEEASSKLADGADFFVAHNADFEKVFFDWYGLQWIDTYKCALRLWPEAPRHSNQVLRYYLDRCDPGKAGMPPHRALPDCRVTALVLARCLALASIDQLEAWSAESPLLPRVPMGKHFKKTWAEVPTDYLMWVLRSGFEPAVMHTAGVEVARREALKLEKVSV